MSTRSIIGTTDGTTFEGIYCHFDGYPDHMLPTLAKIVARDGADALPVLTGKVEAATGGSTASWDGLSAEMPAHDTQLPYPDYDTYLDKVGEGGRDKATADLYTHLRHRNEAEARGQIVKGYGAVMTEHPIRFSGDIVDSDTGWCEWAYLFTDDLALSVYDLTEKGHPSRGRFSYDDLVLIAEDDPETVGRIRTVECGDAYERCSHYAYYHAGGMVPESSRSLGMRQWLGEEPVHAHQAVAVVIGGVRYEVTGGSSVRDGLLSLFLRGGDPLAVARTDLRGDVTETLPGVELVFPPVRAEVAEANREGGGRED